MNYLLDTNLIIIYTKDSNIAAEIENRYNLFSTENKLSVSVVTVGELNAIIKKLKLGERRQKLIQDLLENMVKVDIHFEEVIDLYGDIDAYSQGKLNEHPIEFSARNMGNDKITFPHYILDSLFIRQVSKFLSHLAVPVQTTLYTTA